MTSDPYRPAKNAGAILALRVALGFSLRNPGGDIKAAILRHIATHGAPDPVALKRDAFVKAYHSVLLSFTK